MLENLERLYYFFFFFDRGRFLKIIWCPFWILLSGEKLIGRVNGRFPTGNLFLNWNRFLHYIVPEK